MIAAFDYASPSVFESDRERPLLAVGAVLYASVPKRDEVLEEIR